MRRVWCHVVLVAIHLVFVVIGLACAAKLLDLPRFEAALDAYDRVPEALRQSRSLRARWRFCGSRASGPD